MSLSRDRESGGDESGALVSMVARQIRSCCKAVDWKTTDWPPLVWAGQSMFMVGNLWCYHGVV